MSILALIHSLQQSPLHVQPPQNPRLLAARPNIQGVSNIQAIQGQPTGGYGQLQSQQMGIGQQPTGQIYNLHNLASMYAQDRANELTMQPKVNINHAPGGNWDGVNRNQPASGVLDGGVSLPGWGVTKNAWHTLVGR